MTRLENYIIVELTLVELFLPIDWIVGGLGIRVSVFDRYIVLFIKQHRINFGFEIGILQVFNTEVQSS